ncbi:MAG: GNAT family N-acetyltransferase [Akkermansiaceae bacterium]|jgi:arginine-tRNA-protein transferase|nr:GNAT family N-acetyltransferase [Akkermansiaceae bacterium]
MEEPVILHEIGTLDLAPPGAMDQLWSQGWRHFGRDFFRYSRDADASGQVRHILPLRLDVSRFLPSKSQRRIVRQNSDVRIDVLPARVDEEREQLFHRHRVRFRENIPESLRTFMPSPAPESLPCACLGIEVRIDGRLAAVSYLDVDRTSVSSVYAMFDPADSRRGLGMLTLLEEIRWAREHGRKWLYPGYATREPSAYDYKKSLRPLEYYDWRGNWLPLDG